VISGALPTGLTLSSAGVISGGSDSAGIGRWTATVKVTDSQKHTATKTLSVNSVFRLQPDLSGLVATSGQPYSLFADPEGGFGPYTWTLISGGLPHGITSTSSGLISGTPTATVLQDWTATMRLTDAGSGQTATVPMTFRVWPAGDASTITATSLPNGRVGQYYSAGLTTKTPFTIQPFWHTYAGGLPTGLRIDGDSGIILGTPTQAGTWNVTIGYRTTGGQDVPGRALTIAIDTASTVTVPTISDIKVPLTGILNTGFGASFFVSGAAPGKVSAAGLPAGLSLVPVKGSGLVQQLAGTPTGPVGRYLITITATDNTGHQSSWTVSLTLITGTAPTLAISTPLPGSVALGETYSFKLIATGGTGHYTFSYGGSDTGGPPLGGVTVSADGTVTGTAPTLPASGSGELPFVVSDGVTTILGGTDLIIREP
jgi:hypothetical protein